MVPTRKYLNPVGDFSHQNAKLSLKVTDMVENFPYALLKVCRIDSSYNAELKVDLYDNTVFIKKSSITDDEIKTYNTGNYYLKKVTKNNGDYDVQFEKAKFVRGYKNIIRIHDMLNHISYPIFAMERMHTMYGETIKVDVLDNIIFLPERFNGIADETIHEVNKGRYSLKKIPVNTTGYYQLEIQTVPLNDHYQDESLQVPTKNPKKNVLNIGMSQTMIMDCKVEPEVLLTQVCPNQNFENCGNDESMEFISVRNDELNYDLNIEVTKNSKGSIEGSAMETTVASRNESGVSVSGAEEAKVNLNDIIKEDPDVHIPNKNSLNSKFDDADEIEKYLAFYDNNTLLMSSDDDDDEEDAVDDDDSTSTAERGSTLSAPNDTNEVPIPKSTEKYKCMLCLRKHVTKSEKSMRKHMRKYHEGSNIDAWKKIFDEKKIECKFCKNSYVSGYIFQHMKKKHPLEYVAKRRARAARKVVEADSNQTNCLPYINAIPPISALQNMNVTEEEHEAICRALFLRWKQRLLEPNFYESSTESEVTYGHMEL